MYYSISQNVFNKKIQMNHEICYVSCIPFILGPFRSVAVLVWGRLGFLTFHVGPFWLGPFRFAAVLTRIRHINVCSREWHDRP